MLRDWAAASGVKYRTASAWFHAGTLSVRAQQLPSGTILVDIGEQAGDQRVLPYARVSGHDPRGPGSAGVWPGVGSANCQTHLPL